MRILRNIAALGTTALLAGVGIVVIEHSQLLAQSQAIPKQTKPQSQAPAKPILAVPNEQRIVTLIFSTLIALNQANATGNYTVFRELGAPGFQAANSAARLSEIFAELRKSHFDLSPIVLFKLQLQRKPEIDANGMLRVTGYFPTRPEQVNFDLLYQQVQGQWRLFGIAAGTSPSQQAAVTSATAKPAPAQAPSPSSAVQPTPAAKPSAAGEAQAQKSKPLPDVRGKVEQIETGPPQK